MSTGKDHIVEQGECFSQLAFDNGHFWQTLWNDGGNADIRARRKSPFVLQPGDTVHIPDIRVASRSVATDQVHTFRRRGVPARLRVVVHAQGKPLANQPYEINVDGLIRKGTTDGNGLVTQFVPPDAQQAKLVVGTGSKQRTYRLALRCLNPDTSLEGLQARLANLGYSPGPVDGTQSEALADAIRRFQEDNGLQLTGEDSAALRNLLRDKHLC